MPPDARRRFQILDGIIITAAMAVTLALLSQAPDWSHHVFRNGGFGGYYGTPYGIWFAVRATLVLIPWSVAIFLIGLRRPRPPLRRVVLQPGMAASTAVTLWLALKTLLLLVMMIGYPVKRRLVSQYLGDGMAIVS